MRALALAVAAKHDAANLRHFNLSVLVSDEFMQAVQDGAAWPLVFPLGADEPAGECIERIWPGRREPQRCRVLRRLPARELWQHIMHATHDYAEPGVIFIDRVREADNLKYCEQISATNPCGEIPLPPYGACDLGSLNLTRFVRAPFTPGAAVDFDGIAATAAVATRMLDNVYDVSGFPLPAQRETALASRRIGLGITGLADALLMLGIRYDAARARAIAGEVMRTTACMKANRAPKTQAWSYASRASCRPLMPRGKPR